MFAARTAMAHISSADAYAAVCARSPRFTPPLVKQLEAWGGVKWVFLTHQARQHALAAHVTRMQC
jgi:hypothetical protein